MRIAITVASLAPAYGGPSAKALSLAAALRAHGHQVAVLGCDGADTPGATTLGSMRSFHGTPIPRQVRPLVRAVRQSDVLHVLGVRDPVGTLAALTARVHRVPYLVEPAGMLERRLRSLRVKRAFDSVLGDRLVAASTLVVATSAAERREIASAGVEAGRIRLRFNGIHLAGLFPLPERGALRARLGLADDVPLLLSVGRIAAIKGLEHVAEAVATLPGLHWLVAGPDEGDGTLSSLRLAIRRLGIADRVVLVTEGLWGREKAEALADADAFCMASENESFGSAAAEAACAGLPVAIADRCGVIECLEPAARRTFPYGDVDAMAAAIAWAVGDPAARAAAVTAAERIRSHLDWDAVVQQQLDMYEEACSGT